MTPGSVTAPTAPGRLGEPVQPSAALTYLTDLESWLQGRERELAELDRAALGARDGSSMTGDIALSLALWKAAADRFEQLRTVWDSGRVGPAERERLSSLIWGRLDTTLDGSLVARSSAPGAAGLTVSLPEACRLSDALAGSLRVRLGLELSGLEVAGRLADLRAQLERIRDQVGTEPAGARQQQAAERAARLGRRLADLVAKADRGGDVGGLLEPLEIEATTFERDLIVTGAQRREAGAKVAATRRRRAELKAREDRLRALAAEAVATVDPAPRLAVPDLDALGTLPNTLTALEDYVRRLDRVERALDVVERAYGEALQRHHELAARLSAFAAKAAATGADRHPDVARAFALAADALARRPAQMAIAEQLVTLYQTYLETVSGARTEVRR